MACQNDSLAAAQRCPGNNRITVTCHLQVSQSSQGVLHGVGKCRLISGDAFNIHQGSSKGGHVLIDV